MSSFSAESDTNFLVMELVVGETLADRIKRGAVPVDEALPLFLQIALASFSGAKARSGLERKTLQNAPMSRYSLDCDTASGSSEPPIGSDAVGW